MAHLKKNFKILIPWLSSRVHGGSHSIKNALQGKNLVEKILDQNNNRWKVRVGAKPAYVDLGTIPTVSYIVHLSLHSCLDLMSESNYIS